MLPDDVGCVLIVIVLVVSVIGSVIEKAVVCSVLVTVAVGFVLVRAVNGTGLDLVVMHTVFALIEVGD